MVAALKYIVRRRFWRTVGPFVVVALTGAVFASCDTVNKIVKPVSNRITSLTGSEQKDTTAKNAEPKDAGTVTPAQKAQATQPAPKAEAAKPAPKIEAAKSRVNAEAAKPVRKKSKKQKETVAAIESAAAPSMAPLTIAKDIEGEWIIVAAGAKVISRDEDMPYLTFAGEEHRFYGSNGCNVLNGSYTVEGDRITFSNVLSTMMYCPDTEFDAAISAVIADGRTVSANVKRIGNESYLYINDAGGKALLTLCRHNMSFLNGNWVVTQINGNAVNDDECNIFFDISELKVHGNTGCNYFNGTILMDPEGANSISFSGMGVTHKLCPNSDRERLMLVALEEATTAVAGTNNDTAILLDDSGRQVLTLRRAPLTRNTQN